MKTTSLPERNVSQVLLTNLINALKVAGPENEEGNPTRLKQVAVQRATGIARSTLNDLLKACADGDANPDLRTLCRLANELHIPVAFLLMGPREWLTLLSTFSDMATGEMHHAAAKRDFGNGLRGPQAALQILRDADVYPLPVPKFANADDGPEVDRLERQNAAFRRATLVTASLVQAAGSNADLLKLLTLLAAAYANNDKSRYLNNIA
jgi:transcriptional regulator with XRE-family HTH domain